MKSKLVIFAFLALASCGKPKIFILADSDNDKLYLSDTIKIAFKKGHIGKSPVIAIDGEPFSYRKDLDTIILPLKKNDINVVNFLNKKVAEPSMVQKQITEQLLSIQAIWTNLPLILSALQRRVNKCVSENCC